LSLANYLLGIRIGNNSSEKIRKIWLTIGLIINLGVLIIFKYYNFFIDSFIDLVSLFNYELSRSTTKIVLPLGISFYTFLSISYIVDIYKNSLNAEKDITKVLLTLGFFPIILAGPIQRPSSLLPQISLKKQFNYDQAVDGLRQILWGLFAKVAVADNLAPEVDAYFANINDYSGSALLLGAIFYTIQIYADFSGYSNIAIGTAKLFGFRLMKNFAYPYFSRDIADFWRRWHISLTTWFRDYIFLPLSFSLSWKIKSENILLIKTDLFIYIAVSIVVWFLTGLWHGANYTFIVWGMINGFLLIIYHIQLKTRKKLFKRWKINNNNFTIVLFETLLTISFIIIAWIVFRADSLNHAFKYITRIFSSHFLPLPSTLPAKATFMSFILLFSELLQQNREHALQIEKIKYRIPRWVIYFSIVLLLLFVGSGNQKFIYFQF
jgi:D-alanyl-lipoteichoic acid acyltransferase DltB (MBOAT superfamily)